MIESLLIVQTGFLGDAVLATGMIRAVHEIAPSTRVGFLVREEFVDLFREHPGIASLHAYDKRRKGGMRAIVEEVRRESYAAAVIPHRSVRSAVIPFRAGIQRRVGFRQSDLGLLFTQRVEYNIALSEIDRNGMLLETLGIRTSPEERHGWLVPSEGALKSVRGFYSGEGPKIVIAPGSVWETKRWPAEKFSLLVRALLNEGCSVRLVGSRKEEALCSEIAEGGGLPPEAVLAGRLSLGGLAALCALADRVITNDSAPLHIAESVGTPVTALFGPTVPEFGFAPYLSGSRVVERRGLDCRPCGIHGHRSCPIGTHICMKETAVEDVLGTMDSIVNV